MQAQDEVVQEREAAVSQTDSDAQPHESTEECLEHLARHHRESRPLSTYRLQFNKNFRFVDAKALVPYLHQLGISHIYSSPILQARAGSMHGYDITDHNKLNPEIGSEEELRALVAELRRHGMNQVLDTVPNHMGVGHGTNPWWTDVLENGRSAEHADFFDIDWHPIKVELHNRVLLPILGDQYGQELEAGKIRLEFEEGRFRVRYYDNVLPVDPQTIPMVFVNDDEAQPPDELQQLLRELGELPRHKEQRRDGAQLRRERAPLLRARFAEWAAKPENAARLTQVLARINGTPGKPQSFDRLHELLEAQAYRLAHWRVSAEEINYRRFFDVNDLVGLRMENPRVFAATHKLIRKLLAEKLITGVRIDHLDGLLNPRQYLVRLQMLHAASQCGGVEPRPPLAENGIELEVQKLFGQRAWMGEFPPLYCIVEKILEPGEPLPESWPVDGTSGYDFGNLVNGIFIQRKNEKAFTNIYQRFLGEALDARTLIYDSKKMIMNTALSSEVNVLAHILDEISSSNRRVRDFTRKSLRDVITETIACFPVYRSYVDERGEVSSVDRAFVSDAIQRAKRRNSSTAEAVFDFLRDVLLLKPNPGGDSEDVYRLKLHFALKFQQLTGPVMAKGLEDTVCYVYNRFVAVNEVGGSPRSFGTWMEDFHRGNLVRATKWPFAMLATSTHDTKRSEDVRARLDVLSEMPRLWSLQVMRWRRTNAKRKVGISDGRVVPDANEEYLLYQTLAGAWPLEDRDKSLDEAQMAEFRDRVTAYMIKAIHEAKVNLSWINQNPEYVEAMQKFIRGILEPERKRTNAFVEQMRGFLPPVQYFGLLNSLSQTLLRVTCPGVPDTYQGCEEWDFSLVDPDNRRPVDFARRQRHLQEMSVVSAEGRAAMLAELLANLNDGRAKMWTLMRALCFRRDEPELFRTSEYVPLAGRGPLAEHVCAFGRRADGQQAIAVAPRFTYTLMKARMEMPLGAVWGEDAIELPGEWAGRFKNVMTGEEVVAVEGALPLREVLRSFPVALLRAG